jgi:hypothetical protein
VTPSFYKLRQNTALSRRGSRVRVPSLPPELTSSDSQDHLQALWIFFALISMARAMTAIDV